MFIKYGLILLVGYLAWQMANIYTPENFSSPFKFKIVAKYLSLAGDTVSLFLFLISKF